MLARLAVVLALVTSACGGTTDDPFTADLKRICSIQPDPSAPPDMQRALALRKIASEIKSPEAARLLRDAMMAAPAERAALVGSALDKAGIKRCPTLLE